VVRRQFDLLFLAAPVVAGAVRLVLLRDALVLRDVVEGDWHGLREVAVRLGLLDLEVEMGAGGAVVA
jgi:hypothetical protein